MDVDSDRLETVRSAVEPVDGDRLKRAGVVTYFSVYLVIALGGWRALADLGQRVPRVVRPPEPAPLHVALGLPRSVAWGLVSLSIAFGVVGALAAVQVRRARSDAPERLSDIGDRSWRERLPGRAEIQARLPDRGALTALRARVPDASAVRARIPGRRALARLRPGGGAGARLRVADGTLADPVAPLTLPGAGPGARVVQVLAPESHAVAEGFPGLVEWPESGLDAAGSEVADGGPSTPIPTVLDPEQTLGRATADGGRRAGGADADEESWPGDWQSGDAL